MKKRTAIILSLLAIATVVTATFLPALDNGFVNWDDPLYIQENLKIRHLTWKNVLHIFTSTHLGGYEPFTELSFAIEYHFFGLKPFSYHLTNIVFHLFNSLLAFWLVYRLDRRVATALIAALLFGVHPTRVESVAWVAERKDVLYVFFYLWALLSYLYYLKFRRRSYYLLSIFLFLLSLLPKPQGLALPLVLILFDYLKGRRLSIQVWLEKFPFAIIAVSFFFINFSSQFGAGNLTRGHFEGFISNFRIAIYGLVFYLNKLILPARLSSFYPYPDTSLVSSLFTFAPAILATVILLVVYTRHRSPKVVFAGLFFLFNILLVLQLVPTGPAVAADRYTYLPALGLFYLAGAGFEKLIRQRKDGVLYQWAMTILLLAIVLFYVLLSHHRCQIWKNGVTLWNDVIRNYRSSPIIHLNRGWAFERQGMYETAISSYRLALQLNPQSYRVNNNLGNIYNHLGRYDQAIFHYRKALALKNDFYRAYNNLGNALLQLGDFQAAEAACRRALELKQNFPEALRNLGLILSALGRKEEALSYYRQAVELKPDYAGARFNLGFELDLQGDWAGAELHLREAIRHRPNFFEAYNQLGMIMARQGKLAQAETQYLAALRINPDAPSVHNNLGVVLSQQGRSLQAIVQYRKTLHSAPEFAEAYNNLGIEYSQMGEYDRAVRNYRKALRIRKEYPEAWSNLGLDLAALGRTEEAIQSYNRALELDPAFVDAHYHLARLLTAAGRVVEADSHFREVLRLNPDYPGSIEISSGTESEDNVSR